MNERSFSEKALALAPKWHRIAYAILENEPDCEDAVQEALLRAWAGIGSLKEDKFFETWFTRILINESRRILKKRTFHPTNTLNDNTPSREADNELAGALGALDAKLRLPVILFYMEGYKIAEIAKLLRIPTATAKWRLGKGREVLKRLMKEAQV